jgi:hypothetical protein
MRRAAILLGVPAALAALVAVPLGVVRGPVHWLSAAVAVALTAVPGLVTLVLADRMAKSSPVARVAALVIGPVVRLVVGFGGAVAVFFAAGDTFRAEPVVFWGWLLGMYLVTLIVETVLLGRSQFGSQEPGIRNREEESGRGATDS